MLVFFRKEQERFTGAILEGIGYALWAEGRRESPLSVYE
jgi:hypothetical protein